ncbi:MAG: DNA mismatch repair protein MutS, partial [bacterium]|nr:DNA mismatch repair protein MutS [bacterium]
MQDKFQTPMMQQYWEIKNQYKDCILLFRLGDFYEMFLEDAKTGAKVLGITLTSRRNQKDGDIPMAGIPYHAVENYLYKLVDANFKVAICEQVSDPKQPGIVKREVVRVVTPGTVLSDKGLDTITNNY